MSANKKIPMRMCVGCKNMYEKSSLARMVRGEDGSILFDPSAKMPGRGVYICKNTECIKRAEKSRALQRAFGTELPDSFFENLPIKPEENTHD